MVSFIANAAKVYRLTHGLRMVAPIAEMINMIKIYEDGSSYAWTPKMGEDGVIIRISKSTLGSLSWCAQQMWLQHNYPKPQELVKHLVVGDDVHNGLDLFYQNYLTSSSTG